MVIQSTSRPSEVRKKPITAPERKATTKASQTPLRASSAVRAFA